MRQRGQVFKSGASWKIRLYDADGKRRQAGGYGSKQEATKALEQELHRARRGIHSGDLTFDELIDEYLAQHAQNVEPETLSKLGYQLASSRRAFGSLRIDRITPRAIGPWRATLSKGVAHEAHQALKQVLGYAVRTRLLDENPAVLVPNPRPRAEEMRPFETWEDVEGLAAEMGDWGSAVCFAAATGLRPEELFALERRDLDRSGAVVLVRRVYTRALRVREGGKTDRSVRRVPLSDRALAALDELTIRIDTPLVFPRKDGKHVNQASWRRDEWKPAMRAWLLADPDRVERRPYDLRHTYASFQIAAGVPIFFLARFMGTSLAQIDRTYGHLLPDSEDYIRGLQNAWEREQDERKAETQ